MFWQHFVNKPHWIDKKRQRKVTECCCIIVENLLYLQQTDAEK